VIREIYTTRPEGVRGDELTGIVSRWDASSSYPANHGMCNVPERDSLARSLLQFFHGAFRNTAI
jgi:hypothetical protein